MQLVSGGSNKPVNYPITEVVGAGDLQYQAWHVWLSNQLGSHQSQGLVFSDHIRGDVRKSVKSKDAQHGYIHKMALLQVITA